MYLIFLFFLNSYTLIKFVIVFKNGFFLHFLFQVSKLIFQFNTVDSCNKKTTTTTKS